jgi:hypothetical protein
MANRFPLIVDTDDSNKIKEIPEGDLLDLNNSGIANLGSLSVAGNLSGGALQSSGTLSATGNATLGADADITGDTTVGGTLAVTGASSFTGAITASSVDASGTIDANNFTVNGAPLSSIQVQSDWAETNGSSAAFIRNKPDITAIDSIFQITDVEVTGGGLPNRFDILEFDTDDGGSSFIARTTNRYIRDSDISFNPSPAPVGPNAGSLNVTAGLGTLTIDWTPPNVPSNSTQLTDTANLIRSGDSLGRLDNTTTAFIGNTYYVAGTGIELDTSAVPGQSVINFDNSLAGVQLLGQVGVGSNLTYSKSEPSPGVYQANLALAADITVGSITANDGDTTSTFQDVEVLSLTVNAGGISSANGAIATTNGNITATNGNVVGNNVNATTGVNTPLLANIGSTLNLGANIVALSITPHFRMGQNATLPASPSVGDVWHTGETIATYVNEDGSGNPGWIYLGGVAAPGGISLPTFDNTSRPSAAKAGQMILNTDTSTVQVSDGSTWINIGP